METENYTGPVWVKYNGQILQSTLMWIGEKRLFRFSDGTVCQHADDMTEEEKVAVRKACFFSVEIPLRIVGVTGWWPRETWWTKAMAFIGNFKITDDCMKIAKMIGWIFAGSVILRLIFH